MFNNVALDVVIGLVFIFLLYSLLATIIQELIATKLAFRAKILEKGILRMLEDGKSSSSFTHIFGRRNILKDKYIAAWFYAHPLIKYLGENNQYSKPAYLSAQNFSKVLIDLLKGSGNISVNEVQQLNDSIQKGVIYHLPIDLVSDETNPAIKALRHQLGSAIQNGKGDPDNTSEINPDTKLFLLSLWKEAGADIDKFRQKLEKWFDDTMERTTGWYKKHTQTILIILGFILAAAFNIDSINITKRLIKDPKLREQMVQSANNYMEKNKELNEQLKRTDSTTDSYKLMKADYDDLSAKSKRLMDSAQKMINNDIGSINSVMGLGGWKWNKWHPELTLYKDVNDPAKNQYWFTMIIGWLITALAISLGAPFWFDLLSKIMKVRGAGTKIDSSSQGAQTISITQPTPAAASVNVSTQTGGEAVG